MTKIRIMSDLHLEFGPLTLDPAGEDVLALAGDVGIFIDGIEWADTQAKELGVPVVMIAGNHEFYQNDRQHGHTIESTIVALREASARTNGRVTFLERDVAVVAGVRFIGATLWTDFALFGDQKKAKLAAWGRMNDYRCIEIRRGKTFNPMLAAEEHAASRIFIEDTLAQPFAGPTVVMTHHAPSRKSVAGRYAHDELSPAYASNLEDLVENSGAALWQHGHVHHSFDYMIGSTRVRTNPRGYDGYELNPDFDPSLVLEV